MAQVQPLRIEEDILNLAEIRSKDEHTTKTAAIKQFLYSGAEEYLLKLCSKGRILIGKAAEILHKSIFDLQESAKNKGIELGITAKEYNESKKFAQDLI
jgi:predicted HTH domain antitoxin